MKKNQLTVGRKNNFIDITTLLKDANRRAKLQNFIDEVIRCKTRILDENESIKSLRESAVDELNIEPKMFNSLVGLYFNNNFEEKREELEKLEQAIHMLMQVGTPEE